MSTLPDSAVHYLDGARGIYIPQNFAEMVKRDCVTGVSNADWDVLEAGPDHEWYWETWDSILDRVVITDPDTGERFNIYQDGDVWLIPVGAEWPDEFEFASKEDIFIP